MICAAMLLCVVGYANIILFWRKYADLWVLQDLGSSQCTFSMFCFLWLGRNSSVDRHNRTELAKLQDFEVVTDAKDLITTWEQLIHVKDGCMSSLFDEKRHRLQYDTLKKHSYWEKCRAAKQIHLKIGAQVM